MATVDNRVVSLKFDNGQFQQASEQTLSSLDKLSKGLEFKGAAKGFAGVSAAANSVNLSGIASAVDNISSKFSVLGAIGFSVIQNLTNRFMGMGAQMLTAITTPIIEGGKKRALTIEQAKFQFRGLGMDVDSTMASAKAAVLGTAYGLDEAARAAAMFGASGLRAGKEMTASLRGIAGVAAMSGGSYAEIADIFTNVAGQGRLMGSDLLRMGQRGVNAAAILGKALHKSEAEIRDMVSKGKIDFKTFSNVMNDAFGKHATEANKTYAGSLANVNAALARIGADYFTPRFERMRKIFVELTFIIDRFKKDALDPILKTLGMDMVKSGDNAVAMLLTLGARNKETSATFSNLGKIVRDIFFGIRTAANSVGSVLGTIGDAFSAIFSSDSLGSLASMASDFRALMRTLEPTKSQLNDLKIAFLYLFNAASSVMDGLTNIFIALRTAMVPISVAFDEIFGGGTPSKIQDVVSPVVGLAQAFEDFTVKLIPTGQALENIKIIFKGIFSAFDLAFGTVKFLFDAVLGLFGIFPKGESSLKSFGTSLLDIVLNFSKWITGLNESAKSAGFFKTALDTLIGLFHGVGALGAPIMSFFRGVGEAISKAATAIKNFLIPIGKQIQSAFTGADSLKNIVKLLGGLLAIVVGLKAGSKLSMFSWLSGLQGSGGAMGGIKALYSPLQQMKNVMFQMQQSLKAGVIKQIAIAIAILAASVFILSLVNPARLDAAMQAIIAMTIGIVTIMAKMNTILGQSMPKFGQIAKLGMGLMLIGGALLVMSLALLVISSIDPARMGQGIMGIGELLGMMYIFAKYVNKDNGLIAAGFALILLAVGLNILAGALFLIGSMKPAALEQGLMAVGLALGTFVTLSNMVDETKITSLGVALLALGASMFILALAIKIIGTMSPEQMGVGLLGLAGGLLMMVLAVQKLPKDGGKSAAAMVVIAFAVALIAVALKIMGSMDFGSMMTAIIGMAASLLMITVMLLALDAVKGNILMGAFALLIVSGAMILLSIALRMMGSIPIGQVIGGLIGLAAAMLVMGIAGYLLIPAIPGMLAFAAAALLFGIAIFAVGAGLLAFGIGLGLIAAAAAAGTAPIIAMILALIGVLPLIALAIAGAIGAFAMGLVQQAGAILAALTALIGVVLGAIIANFPKLIVVLDMLIKGIVQLLVTNIPIIVIGVLALLTAILTAIANWLPKIMVQSANIIAAFINGLANNLGKIIAAGVNLIVKLMKGVGDAALVISTEAAKTLIKFINGLSAAIDKYGPQIRTAMSKLVNSMMKQISDLITSSPMGKLGGDIVNGITKGIDAATKGPLAAIKNVIDGIVSAARAAGLIRSPSRRTANEVGRPLVEGLASGILENASTAKDAATKVVMATVTAMQLASDAANNVLLGIDDPVISPVIDMDAVYNGAREIASVMSGASAINVSGSVQSRLDSETGQNGSGSGTDAADRTTTIQFNQTNNSPKAIGRLEVYRQTQNQLRELKRLGVTP